MSSSGRKIFAVASGVGTDTPEPTLLVSYKYQPPFTSTLGVIDGGTVAIPMLGRTESELNAVVQQAVLEYCQNETSFTQDFVLTDVTGGRI